MQNRQPKDEWTFLRPDEFVDDNEVERIDQVVERGPEETAMHVEHLRRPVTDPGQSDVEVGSASEQEMPVSYFEDEQPEATASPEVDQEREPDLEELLESQHYAFEQSEG